MPYPVSDGSPSIILYVCPPSLVLSAIKNIDFSLISIETDEAKSYKCDTKNIFIPFSISAFVMLFKHGHYQHVQHSFLYH